LGLANDCLAFDINLACSGYGYALWLAATTAKQTGKKVLILDGDVQSVFTSPYDKSTMPVLSDAGTATIIENTNHDEEWIFTFFTDGSKRDVLSIKAGGSKLPTTQDDLYYNDYQDGSKRRNIDITMDGFEVFRFVAQTVSKYLSDFLALVGIAPQEIDAFIPHQANMYMIKQLAKKIGINTEKVWLSGDKYGNSGSATIPVTIASEYPGKVGSANKIKVLLSGFGAGLSISAAIISMDSEIRCRIFKYNGEQ
jgi:3-oxoacyl-[acyl-carrier-protein] synthase-3